MLTGPFTEGISGLLSVTVSGTFSLPVQDLIRKYIEVTSYYANVSDSVQFVCNPRAFLLSNLRVMLRYVWTVCCYHIQM